MNQPPPLTNEVMETRRGRGEVIQMNETLQGQIELCYINMERDINYEFNQGRLSGLLFLVKLKKEEGEKLS